MGYSVPAIWLNDLTAQACLVNIAKNMPAQYGTPSFPSVDAYLLPMMK